ncbi:hypothetical protein VNO77_33166 [Canavalia gladiata]|uniref:Uncharacterized protein n=1 Tax=Canavalia gladiata TaxID=3824 RepID=A0AAN9KCV0_CANGL
MLPVFKQTYGTIILIWGSHHSPKRKGRKKEEGEKEEATRGVFDWLLCFPPSLPFSGTLKSFYPSTQVGHPLWPPTPTPTPSTCALSLCNSFTLLHNVFFNTPHAPIFVFCLERSFFFSIWDAQ